ncbi:MAG TPA: hypothetical protein VGJ70_12705, partial [Solirubrobacteraceae bacterium]
MIDADERRASSIPHRERQLSLVRSLGRRLLQAHVEWLDEVERERPAGADGPVRPAATRGRSPGSP